MDEKMPFRTDYGVPAPPADPSFPTGRPEFRCLGISVVLGILLGNFLLFGGFQLGFALVSAALILFVGICLLRRGHRLTPYCAALLTLSLVICGSFARSDDGFVKFMMLLFLAVSASLGLCLLAGKNWRAAGGISSLLDAPRVWLVLSFGSIGTALRGLNTARKQASGTGKKQWAVFAGLAAAIPLLAIVIPLLMRSDAAFEGFMALLPDFNFAEAFLSLAVGLPAALILYTVTTALHHKPQGASASPSGKRLPTATVNGVLGALCGVYLLYLFSQLAYIFGGFSGILPEGYTLSQYARRGFFEMAWLSAINLTVIALAVGFTRKQGKVIPSTRWLCLFIGLVTLFFVIAACAKMLLYIDVYGLTRLRVLTQVILVFLGITTVLVCVFLFVPKFAYMKPILLLALLLGAGIAWADVDTVVAAYNVNRYLDGRLETVDTSYLGTLGAGAVPQLARLAENAPDWEIAGQAQQILNSLYLDSPDDFRDWNYSSHAARSYLHKTPQDALPDVPPETTPPVLDIDPVYPNSLGIYAFTPINGCVCLAGTDAWTGAPVWYLYMPGGELMGPFETEAAMLTLFPEGILPVWMELEGMEVWTQGQYRSFRGRSLDGHQILLWLMDTGASVTHGPIGDPQQYFELCKELGLEPPPYWTDWQYYLAG